MNSVANVIAGICFLLLSIPVMGLGILEGHLVAGTVGAVVMMVIAWAFFHKGEQLFAEESINRRLFKGKLN